MVLFKSSSIPSTKSSQIIYIPIWFYSNLPPLPRYRRYSPIYIPIWFYSNYRHLRTNLLLNDLHSNMVLFKLALIRSRSYKVHYLHSNMVLFKSRANLSMLKTELQFTFQYGSIQMRYSALHY